MRSFNWPGDLLIESLHTKSISIHLKQISLPLINFYWRIVWNGGEESIFGPSQIIAREETAVAWRLTAKQIEIKSSFRRTFFMKSQSWTNQATHNPTIKLCGSLQGLIKFQISDGRSKQPIPFFSFVTFLLDSLFHPFGVSHTTHVWYMNFGPSLRSPPARANELCGYAAESGLPPRHEQTETDGSSWMWWGGAGDSALDRLQIGLREWGAQPE